MSQVAQELDEVVMDLVRDALRDYVLDEIVLACMAIDVIRNINENKYLVVKEVVYNGDI